MATPEMTAQQKLLYKETLKNACQAIITQRIAATRAAIDDAQQTANQEEKSSAGDKYETSRAMGHLEKDMQTRQLAAHLKELASLHSINIAIIYKKAASGAVIQTTGLSFFIACGLGKQLLNDTTIVFLSPHAPLAQSLFSKKIGDTVLFNGIENVINDVF